MTTNVYVLRLEGEFFYVGKSEDEIKRYQDHLQGRGPAWTKLHRVLALETVHRGVSPYAEDMVTLEYMSRYGISKVRGGTYSRTNLDPATPGRDRTKDSRRRGQVLPLREIRTFCIVVPRKDPPAPAVVETVIPQPSVTCQDDARWQTS